MSRAAAYGRYARNAMIQGAAAELFKVWAVIVRARCAPLGARIVLCLHDELLVHVPRAGGAGVPAGRRVPAGSRAALGARLRGPFQLRHYGRPQLVGRQERGPDPGKPSGPGSPGSPAG
jgi:DNA polymerase I - 3''-5'' exonuclease and polymerase domains